MTFVSTTFPALLQVVTPWDVKGGSDGKIDYAKLSREASEIKRAMARHLLENAGQLIFFSS